MNPLNNNRETCIKCLFWDHKLETCSKRLGNSFKVCIYDPGLFDMFSPNPTNHVGRASKFELMGKSEEEVKVYLKTHTNKEAIKDFQVTNFTICAWRRNFNIKCPTKTEIIKMRNIPVIKIGSVGRKSPHVRFGYTPEQFQEELRNLSEKDAMELFECSYPIYRNWLLKYKVVEKHAPKKRKVLKQVSKDELINLLKKFEDRQIANKLSVNTSSITYWRKKFNIEMK